MNEQQRQAIMIERQRQAIHNYANRQRFNELIKPPKQEPRDNKRG